MFFRREAPRVPSFAERLERLRTAGFATAPAAGGATKVTRGAVGAALTEVDGQVKCSSSAGLVMGDEIGSLVDSGYQKIFRAPSGRTSAASAGDLRAIHEFEEDLKEALGLESLYNESLGTVSTYYLYDRVKDRDHGVPKRVWES